MHVANLKALISALNARDYYAVGHAARVAAYMLLLGRELGWPQNRLQQITEAAFLHDVGRIGISDDVLYKPGRLSDEEAAELRASPDRERGDHPAAVHARDRARGAPPSRALGRRRLPGRAGRRADPGGGPRPVHRRLLRRDVVPAPAPRGALVRGVPRRAGPLPRQPVRPGHGDRVHARAGPARRAPVRRARGRGGGGLPRRPGGPRRASRSRGTRARPTSSRWRASSARSATPTPACASSPPSCRVTTAGGWSATPRRSRRCAPTPATSSSARRCRTSRSSSRPTATSCSSTTSASGSAASPRSATPRGLWSGSPAPTSPPADDWPADLGTSAAGHDRTFSAVVESATARLGRARVDAVTDGLTGLYNQRYFKQRLSEEVERGDRAGPASLPALLRPRPLQGLQRPPRPRRRRQGAARRRRRAPALDPSGRPGRALRRRGADRHPARHAAATPRWRSPSASGKASPRSTWAARTTASP